VLREIYFGQGNPAVAPMASAKTMATANIMVATRFMCGSFLKAEAHILGQGLTHSQLWKLRTWRR